MNGIITRFIKIGIYVSILYFIVRCIIFTPYFIYILIENCDKAIEISLIYDILGIAGESVGVALLFMIAYNSFYGNLTHLTKLQKLMVITVAK